MEFEKLDRLKEQLDRLRPIPPDKMEAIDEKLTIEWTYNSNAIEGNTLSLRETAFFLKRGLTLKGKSLVEHLEARNHAEAIEYLRDIVESERELTEGLIKELHALIMKGIDWMWIGPREQRVRKPTRPGQYKIEPNHVIQADGTVHYYCDPIKVPDEMEKLMAFFRDHQRERHPVELSAEMHYGFVAVHPFADGNGRVGRLLMNLILMQSGYPPAVIQNAKREEYYDALMTADKGDLSDFISLVANEVESTIRMMLEIADRPLTYSAEDVMEQFRRLDAKLQEREEIKEELLKEDSIRRKRLREMRDALCSIINERRPNEMKALKALMDYRDGSLGGMHATIRDLFEPEELGTFWETTEVIRVQFSKELARGRQILGHLIVLLIEGPEHYEIVLFPSTDPSARGAPVASDRITRIQVAGPQELQGREPEINRALVEGLRLIRERSREEQK